MKADKGHTLSKAPLFRFQLHARIARFISRSVTLYWQSHDYRRRTYAVEHLGS